MTQPFLPYGQQEITDEDKQAVLEALDHPFLTTGPKVGEFECEFAGYTRSREAVAVSNGTAALHVAALAAGISIGDKVLASTMSFAASANGAAYAGAEIVFMDCDPETGLTTPQQFIEAAERAGNPKMAVVVHLNGEHADMAAIAREAQKRNILLVEDACHALGTQFEDEDGNVCMVGQCRYSAMSVFSFHPVKTMTSGEGGMITCNDAELAQKLRRMRAHGIERESDAMQETELAFDKSGSVNPWYYEMQDLGFNYRLTDIACALGLSQLSRMDTIVEKRRRLKSIYDELLQNSNIPVKPVRTPDGVDPVRHLYPLLIDFEAIGMERSAVMQGLREQGIGTQVHYIPIHLQPWYRRQNPDLILAGAERYYETALSMPFYAKMDESDPERVIEAVRRVIC
ncbi:MAG: UDP-4-amino-4,6-dideoxy-N-acetyl-beta-L-altrosamine transaminase [Pseudomonadota bacterium]